MAGEKQRATDQGDDSTKCSKKADASPSQRTYLLRINRPTQHQARVLGQTPQHIHCSAARAYILGAGESLFKKAKQFGAGLPLLLPIGHADIAQPIDYHKRTESKNGHCCAYTPVDAKEHDENANQQQRIA